MNFFFYQFCDFCFFVFVFCFWYGGCFEFFEEIWCIVVVVNFYCVSIIVFMYGVFGFYVGIFCFVFDDGFVDRYIVYGILCFVVFFGYS